jgi:hypothetical protein
VEIAQGQWGLGHQGAQAEAPAWLWRRCWLIQPPS